MFTTTSQYNKSVLHRLNPTLKIIGFVLIICMIFLPLGFFAQIILFIVLSILFILAKISRKTFFNIVKSALILLTLLILINWIIYKDPIAVNITNQFDIILGNKSIIWGPISNLSQPNNGIYISDLWGGKVGGIVPTDSVFIDKVIAQNNVDEAVLVKSWNGLNLAAKENLLQAIGLAPGAEATPSQILAAQKYYWVVNNEWTLDGQSYKTLAITNSSSYHNAFVYFQTNWYTFSPQAIQLAIFVTLKVMLMIMAATLLTSTTNSLELTYAFENLLSPLKIFRLPVNEASMMIAIALRFIPSLLIESKRIMNAQASRGIDFKNGNFAVKMKALVSLIVPLFSIAFKKAEELANAIDARAYNPRYARTRYRKFSVSIWEWLGFSILALLLGLYIGVTIKPLLFSPLGLFEIGVLS